MVMAILFMFWSLVIPIAYLLLKRRHKHKGILWKAMAAAIVLHLIWIGLIWCFVYWNWKAGYSEYYYGWYLVWPVNFACVMWCAVSPFLYKLRSKNRTAQVQLCGGNDLRDFWWSSRLWICLFPRCAHQNFQGSFGAR